MAFNIWDLEAGNLTDISGILGYVPYNGATNPNGYITSAAIPVTSVFGRTGAVVLESTDVTTALGFTPYNSTNPSNYITSAQAPVQSVNGSTGAVVIPAASYVYVAETPTTGSNLTVPNNTNVYYVEGSTTLASLSITLPVTPNANNFPLTIVFGVAVTSLIISANTSQTLLISTPTSAVVGSIFSTVNISGMWIPY